MVATETIVNPCDDTLALSLSLLSAGISECFKQKKLVNEVQSPVYADAFVNFEYW